MNELGPDVEIRRFYRSFKDAVERVTGSNHPPLVLALLSLKSNDRAGVLRNGSIDGKDVAFTKLRSLVDSRLVRETDERSRYTITALGVWSVESKEGTADVKSIVDFIDDRFFKFPEAQPPLSEKEKVILGTFVAARAFSPDSTVDLSSDDQIRDEWGHIITQVWKEFKALHIVTKLTEEDLFRRGGIEHPVSHLIRHTDALPKKTRGLYVARKLQYFLNLIDDHNDIRRNLAYILARIFSGAVGPGDIDHLVAFFRSVAYGEGMRVFDLSRHRFASIKGDEDIEYAVRMAVMQPEDAI